MPDRLIGRVRELIRAREHEHAHDEHYVSAALGYAPGTRRSIDVAPVLAPLQTNNAPAVGKPGGALGEREFDAAGDFTP